MEKKNALPCSDLYTKLRELSFASTRVYTLPTLGNEAAIRQSRHNQRHSQHLNPNPNLPDYKQSLSSCQTCVEGVRFRDRCGTQLICKTN